MTDPKKQPLAWSGSNTLITGNADKAFKITAGYKGEPQYYTAQFNVNPPPTLALNEICWPRAELVWSVEGNSVRRLISVYDGAVISGCAESVDIKMFDASRNGSGLEYPVSVQVTRGTRPSIQQPPLLITETREILAPSPVAGLTFQVPQDAGVVAFYPEVAAVDAAGATIANDEVKVSVTSTAAGISQIGYDGMFRWTPLTPGATIVLFNNFRAAGDIACGVIWGIEG